MPLSLPWKPPLQKRVNVINSGKMRISKVKLNQKTQKEVIDNLFQVLADLKSEAEIRTFLTDFLTEAELVNLAKRISIAYQLEKDTPYSEIKKDLNVSSATVAAVQEMINKKPQAFIKALKILDAQKWADKTSQEISGFFKSLFPA